MKKFKALIVPSDVIFFNKENNKFEKLDSFWHFIEEISLEDAKDFFNQFCSVHSAKFEQLQIC